LKLTNQKLTTRLEAGVARRLTRRILKLRRSNRRTTPASKRSREFEDQDFETGVFNGQLSMPVSVQRPDPAKPTADYLPEPTNNQPHERINAALTTDH
jgi:hypothetical protein